MLSSRVFGSVVKHDKSSSLNWMTLVSFCRHNQFRKEPGKDKVKGMNSAVCNTLL